MHSRNKNKRTARRNVRRRNQFTLERLTPRQLLSTTADWLDFLGPIEIDEYSGFDSPESYVNAYLDDLNNGYGLPALEYIDEFAEDADMFAPSVAQTTEDATDTEQAYFGSTIPAAASSQTSVLFLDFDGAVVTSRIGDFNLGSSSITIPAYDLSLFGWGGMEQESINQIMQYVSEDYAAYNITVTCQQPTSGEYTTLYVGGTNDWFRPGSGVIGVATYDIGNRDDSNYGFAFSEELDIYAQYSYGDVGRFSEYLANLISHEAAHTYGANHVDDTAALMNPYLPLTPRRNMFGSGEIPGTTSFQDTEQLMANNLGYAGASDDYGDNFSSARAINLTQVINGMLERRDDVDAFYFTATVSGTVVVDVTTPEYGNLDSTLSIYSYNSGSFIATNDDDGNSTDSCVSFNAVAGQQYSIYVGSSSSNSNGSYTLSFGNPDPHPALVVTDSIGNSSDLRMDFGAVTLADHTAVITLTNDGMEDLVISRLTSSGAFELDHTSSGLTSADDIVIAPDSSLDVTVTFSPETYANYSTYVIIESNDPYNEDVVLTLTGNAPLPVPDITLSGSTYNAAGLIDFGDIQRDIQATQTITITNTGTDTLTINGVGLSEPFTFTAGFNGSAIDLPVGDSVDLTIAITPTQGETLNGRLTLLTNDPDESVVSVVLVGQAVAPEITVQETAQIPNDNQITLDTIYVGETISEIVTISNTGDDNLTLTGLTVDGGFTIDTMLDPNNAGSQLVLAPGETINVTVGFNPTEAGSATGTLTIYSNDGTNSQVDVELQAEALAGGLEIIEMDGSDDGQLDLGPIDINQDSSVAAYRFWNHSGREVTVRLGWAHGDDFELDNDYLVIAPGASQIVNVVVDTNNASRLSDTLCFTSTGPGATSDTLEVTADAYATISRLSTYSFVDHSGDHVRLSLSGGAAQVRLGENDRPDIESITFTNASSNAVLSIMNLDRGTTELGSITGSADLQMINANVQLVGAIDIDGDVDYLQLAGISGDAEISFSTDSAYLRLGTVSANPNIDIDGDISLLWANSLGGGSLDADSIGTIIVADGMNMDINLINGGNRVIMVQNGDLSGNVTANGSIGSVFLFNGDLTGSLKAASDINFVYLPKGTISGELTSSGSIKNIMAANVRQANISALLSVDNMLIQNDVSDSMIAIGNSRAAFAQTPLASEVNARLGFLRVGGTYSGSSIAVGVSCDEQGDLLHGDPTAAAGQVGTVIINNVETQNNDNPFGLVARDKITTIRVNNQTINTSYNQDDFYVMTLAD
ncbi:MAG: choice-of-anchor D domain-containing protein [Sedimentisphaerales bacterium]|nr:choice-of-anchor D domain-containing protein [Sedimentisphaerales bacterium]